MWQPWMRDEPFRLHPWDLKHYTLREFSALIEYAQERQREVGELNG